MARSSVAGGSLSICIADANVLIDYLNADITVLGLFAKHVGTVYVIGVLLRDEVKGLTEAQCKKAGLIVVEAETEILIEAGARSQGSMLSLYDWICLLEAKKRKAHCLTSDGALLNRCRKEGVETRRGFSPLLELVALGQLEGKAALALAKQMAAKNPYLVKVLPELERDLSSRSKGRR